MIVTLDVQLQDTHGLCRLCRDLFLAAVLLHCYFSINIFPLYLQEFCRRSKDEATDEEIILSILAFFFFFNPETIMFYFQKKTK